MMLALILIGPGSYPVTVSLRGPFFDGTLQIHLRTRIREEFVTSEEALLTVKDKAIRIEGIHSMEGHVRVKSEQAALALVRFFTLPSTYNLFCEADGYYIEPMRIGDTKGKLLGTSENWAASLSYRNGVSAIYDEKAYAQLELPPVSVDKVGSFFTVSRPLVNFRYFGKSIVDSDLVIVTETVSSIGGIERVISSRKKFHGLFIPRSFECDRMGGLMHWRG